MEVLYTTTASFSGGSIGHAKTEDDILSLEIRTPKEMGGPGGEYTNPEQLFALGYASCFGSALQYASMIKKKNIECMVTTKVLTGKKQGGGFQFEVEMDIRMHGVDQHEAEELVHNAKQICPYSNAIRNNVKEKIKVITV